MLSQDQFEKAEEYLKNHARDLEYLLFQYEFGTASSESVIKELQSYQNQDGGFGHGLEPDIQMDSSSIYVTTVAFQYLDLLELDSGHSMIQNGLTYMIDQLQIAPKNEFPYSHYWYPTELDVNEHPHAPWWSVDELTIPDLDHWSNPSVEVIGYLKQYADYVPSDLLKALDEDITSYLDSIDILGGGFYYNYLCWKRTMPYLSSVQFEKLTEIINETLTRDPFLISPTAFEKMKIQWFVTEPSSYLNQQYPGEVEELFLKEIKRQTSNGSWKPTWKWGDDDLWSNIARQWSGKITLELLLSLKYMELIEDIT